MLKLRLKSIFKRHNSNKQRFYVKPQKLKTQLIEEAKDAASKEAKKVMDAAKLSIEQSRKEAELQFRNEVSNFALQIAEKVMRNNLQNEKAQTELVNKLIDEVEAKN